MINRFVSFILLLFLIISTALPCLVFAEDKVVDWDSLNSTKENALSNQDLSDQHLDVAQTYIKQGNDELAIQELSKAIEIDSQNADAYELRAGAYTRAGSNEMAISDYTRLLQLCPNDASIYSARGLVYYELGQNNKATADFKKASELNPEMTVSFQGDAQKSEQVYNIPTPKNTLKKIPMYSNEMTQSQKVGNEATDIKRYIERGIKFSNAGEFKKAQKEFSNAIHRTPSNPEFYLLRADTYLKLTNRESAIADIEKALQIKPDYKLALEKHFEIMFLIEKEFRQKTLQDALDLIKTDPTKSKYYKVVANIYFHENKYFSATVYTILSLKVTTSNKVNSLLKIFIIKK